MTERGRRLVSAPGVRRQGLGRVAPPGARRVAAFGGDCEREEATSSSAFGPGLAEDRLTGELLAQRPEWRGSLVGGGSVGRWRLTASARYTGDRVDFGSLPLADYWLAGLAVERPLGRSLTPYGRVENLFDEAYEEAIGFPGAGRSLVAGLAIDLGGLWRAPAAP